MLYENAQDRAIQTGVLQIVGRAFGAEYFITETTQEEALPYDFVIWNEDQTIHGIGELKCRRGQYTDKYLWKHGVLMAQKTLTALKQSADGLPCYICIRTSDSKLYMTTLEILTAYHHLIRVVHGKCKDNHGEIPSDRVGLILPMKLFMELVSKESGYAGHNT